MKKEILMTLVVAGIALPVQVSAATLHRYTDDSTMPPVSQMQADGERMEQLQTPLVVRKYHYNLDTGVQINKEGEVVSNPIGGDIDSDGRMTAPREVNQNYR